MPSLTDLMFSKLAIKYPWILGAQKFVVVPSHTPIKELVKSVATTLDAKLCDKSYICIADINGEPRNVMSLLPTAFVVIDANEGRGIVLLATIKTANLDTMHIEVAGSFGAATFRWDKNSVGLVKITGNDQFFKTEKDKNDLAKTLYGYVVEVLRAYVSGGSVVQATATRSKLPPTKSRPAYKLSYTMVQLPGVRSERKAHQGGTHASPRQHERRGHWRTYRSGKRVWVKNCVVGDPSLGHVKHAYVVTQGETS